MKKTALLMLGLVLPLFSAPVLAGEAGDAGDRADVRREIRESNREHREAREREVRERAERERERVREPKVRSPQSVAKVIKTVAKAVSPAGIHNPIVEDPPHELNPAAVDLARQKAEAFQARERAKQAEKEARRQAERNRERVRAAQRHERVGRR